VSEVENFHGRKLSRSHATAAWSVAVQVAKRQSSAFRKRRQTARPGWTGFDNRDGNTAPLAGDARNPIVLEVLRRVGADQLHHSGTHHLGQFALRAFLGHQ